LRKDKYISFVILLQFIFVSSIFGQVKTSVLTRILEKQYSIREMPLLNINTERGIITVKGWERNEIKVTLKLSAKNKDLDKARKELDYMKYSITGTWNSVYVSNRMLLTNPNQEISSVIIAEYEIFVPYSTKIHAENRFGKLVIRDIKGLLEGELNYSDLSLLRKSGEINFLITIGDFSCTKSKLNGKIVTKHSNLSISETIGRLILETEYGNLRLNYGSELLRLGVISNATDINIENKSCKPLQLHLSGAYCPLKIDYSCYTPDKNLLKSDYNSNAEQEGWKLIYWPAEKGAVLNINAKFGSINLF
jgi:hypothetical protein